MNKHVALSPQLSWKSDLISVAQAGAVTGGVVQVLTFPSDPVLTRMQVQGDSFRMAVHHVAQQRMWFSGLKGPLISAMLRRSITFFPMEGGKYAAKACDISVFWGGMMGSAVGGFVESMVTTVSERYKTIKQSASASGSVGSSFFTAEKLRYWYRGGIPNTLKNVTANPILFAVSPKLHGYMPASIPDAYKPSVAAFCLAHVVQLWGAPLDRCRALMQTPGEKLPSSDYKGLGFVATLKQMYQQEGVSGMLRGYWLRSFRVGMVSGLTLMIYPKVMVVISRGEASPP